MTSPEGARAARGAWAESLVSSGVLDQPLAPFVKTDNPTGPIDGLVKVRRGGSWHTWPLYARCSYRNWNAPDTRYTLVGIRLVMEALN